ncbi:MAG: fasciclin domain-containing protein [Bacteroidota bacterium]
MLLVAGSVFFAACSEDDDNNNEEPQESNTIVDVAAGNSDFSLLVDALSKTGLDEALGDETGSFTVFAPTDEAFTALLDELDAESLDDVADETLTEALLYHVVEGNMGSSSISTGYYNSLSSGPAEGYNLSFYVDMDDARINDRADIIETDVSADNGVIHVIDEVLIPLSVTGHAVANENLSALTGAVTKAGLAETLDSDENIFTVFAPVDAAFETFLSDLGVTLDDLTAEDLTPILLYHALDGFVGADDVSSGYFPTLSPSQERSASLQVTVDDDGVFLNGNKEVIMTDVVATNGVVHVIDGVVQPMTVVDIAANNPSFSTLVEAVTQAELVETLNGEGPFTVFAPTNDAFDQLFEALDVNGVEDIDHSTLTDVLLAHVVSGNVASTDLTNGEVSTLNENKTLEINIDDGVVIDGEINVVLADVQGSNGVVHAIDQVIVP